MLLVGGGAVDLGPVGRPEQCSFRGINVLSGAAVSVGQGDRLSRRERKPEALVLSKSFERGNVNGAAKGHPIYRCFFVWLMNGLLFVPVALLLSWHGL